MLCAHKLLHEGQKFISMSYPVGSQPKSLPSVTPANIVYGSRASGLITAKALSHSTFRDSKEKHSAVKYACYTVLDKRETCDNC